MRLSSLSLNLKFNSSDARPVLVLRTRVRHSKSPFAFNPMDFKRNTSTHKSYLVDIFAFLQVKSSSV